MTQSEKLHKKLHICDNPLMNDRIATIRSKYTDNGHFKFFVEQISYMLAYETSRFLQTETCDIETPVDNTSGQRLKMNKSPLLVPILRAGLGLTKGFEYFYPTANTGHIGVYRDEQTKEPVEYLVKLPNELDRPVFLLDPMLATGHSAIYAAKLLIENGAKASDIIAVFMISAPEGIAAFQDAHPDIQIVTATRDSHLNENAYIVPGLGDAGDRLFGTD